MDQPPLGIQAKLDRSQEHFDVLDELIGSYLRTEPYRFIAEEYLEGDAHHYAIFLEVDTFPPDGVWGPVIGDVVHNLRSALDHLAWQLALPTARSDTPRRIEFPIFLEDPTDDPEVRGALRKKLQCLRPDCHAVIDAAQPYKTRDTHHPLWLLQALWNTDKHRTLHTTGFLFGSPEGAPSDGFGFGSWSNGPFDRENPEKRTKLAGGFGRTQQPVEDQVNAYEASTVDVSLSAAAPSEHWWTGSPFAGLPVRQVLTRIRSYVDAEVVGPLSRLL